MPPPRIVVFDLGGVIVRICRSWKEACDRCSLPYYEPVTEPARVAERKTIRALHEIGAITDDEFYTRLAATTGDGYTPQQVCAIHHHWTIGEYPGVGQVIDDLHARGVDTGVLSNTNAHHWRLLTAQGTSQEPPAYPTIQRIRHVHASHLLRLAKPDPAIYHAFAQKAGYQPHQILFFDDLAENVAGAQNAGWDAVQIDHAAGTPSQMRLHLRLRGLDI